MPNTACPSFACNPDRSGGRADITDAHPGRRGSARLKCGVVLAAVLCAAAPAWASDDRAAPAAKPAAAKPAAKAPAAAPAAATDPMDTLREKLAAKLGAVKAPESASPYVVRVVAKSGDAARGGPTAEPKAGGQGTAAKAAKPRAVAAGLPDGHAAHWSYGGAGGPEQWGAMKSEFSTCSTGSRQSPIDIRSGVRVDLEPIQFDYRPSGFRVIDNGHTIQVNVGGGNSIEVQGRRYDLVQFHFHRPSEERIDGRQFDMVAHLVHKDPEGRLAVVAVLLDRGSAHPLVQTIWNNLPLEKGEEVAAKAALDMNHLLPADRRYYTYMGSLTTPPCSEGVLWMVMQQPVPIATDQINVFSRLYPMNARPVQSAAGRLIKQSN
jgi:carbonic anhydrase